MKIAYLVNQYPKVSHTFVRREIRALERRGVAISRFSVRRAPDVLVDDEDREEAGRTDYLLDAGPVGLARALGTSALRGPRRFARALSLTLSLGWRSDRGLPRHLAYLAEACVLRAALAAKQVHHLHVHFGANSATVALLCRALGGPTYSFTAHGPEEFDRAPLIGLGTKIEHAAFVVAISHFGRSQLMRQCGADHWGKLQVVRCGVDRSFLDAPIVPVPAAPKLVCVGRLAEQKGPLLLVEALGRLHRERRDFELAFVGDGELRGPVEAAIAREGLEGKVRITGWADGAAVRAALTAARALVLPSFAEGLPVVIMEALALGRPVVSTYVAGIPELVEPGKSGWLVPAGSVDGLVVALREALAATPEALGALGRHGRAQVEALHEMGAIAERLEALFAPLAASGAAGIDTVSAKREEDAKGVKVGG